MINFGYLTGKNAVCLYFPYLDYLIILVWCSTETIKRYDKSLLLFTEDKDSIIIDALIDAIGVSLSQSKLILISWTILMYIWQCYFC